MPKKKSPLKALPTFTPSVTPIHLPSSKLVRMTGSILKKMGSYGGHLDQTESDPDDDATIEQVVEDIEQLLVMPNQCMLKIGEKIFRHFYASDLATYRTRGPNVNSIRKLASLIQERGRISEFQNSTLSDCVQVYVQEEDLGLRALNAERLHFDARVALLSVEDVAKKKALARGVIKNRWGVAELKRKIEGDQGKAPGNVIQETLVHLKVLSAQIESGIEITSENREVLEDSIVLLEAMRDTLVTALKLFDKKRKR